MARAVDLASGVGISGNAAGPQAFPPWRTTSHGWVHVTGSLLAPWNPAKVAGLQALNAGSPRIYT